MIKFVFFTAIFIVAALSLVALYFLLELYKLKKRQRKQGKERLIKREQQRSEVNKSIQVLAGAVGRNELTLTEASIRIAGLLDVLNVSENVKSDYAGFYQLREATAHIPILAAWKALSAKEKYQFTQERTRCESLYGDFVIDAAKRMEGVTF